MTPVPFTTKLLHEKIDQLRSGDRTAQDELILAIHDRMYRLAKRMLRAYPSVRASADAQDVLQNTFLRLLNALGKIRPASTRDFYRLAAHLVRQELIDLLRRFARRRADRLPDGVEVTAPTDGLDVWVHFHRAVDALPDDEREVFSLRFYHGRLLEEIATVVGVDVRTVRRRWVAACGALRDALQEDLDQLFS